MICLQSKEKSLSTRHRHSFQRIWRKQHQDNVNMCDEHLLNLCWIWFMLNIPQANMKLLLHCICANYKYAATYVGVRHLWIPNLQRCDKKVCGTKCETKSDVVVALHQREMSPISENADKIYNCGKIHLEIPHCKTRSRTGTLGSPQRWHWTPGEIQVTGYFFLCPSLYTIYHKNLKSGKF